MILPIVFRELASQRVRDDGAVALLLQLGMLPDGERDVVAVRSGNDIGRGNRRAIAIGMRGGRVTTRRRINNSGIRRVRESREVIRQPDKPYA